MTSSIAKLGVIPGDTSKQDSEERRTTGFFCNLGNDISKWSASKIHKGAAQQNLILCRLMDLLYDPQTM